MSYIECNNCYNILFTNFSGNDDDYCCTECRSGINFDVSFQKRKCVKCAQDFSTQFKGSNYVCHCCIAVYNGLNLSQQIDVVPQICTFCKSEHDTQYQGPNSVCEYCHLNCERQNTKIDIC